MANQIDIGSAERIARELLESRVESVRELARKRQARNEAAAALEVAERQDADAYAAATRAGWTAAELRKAGFEPAVSQPKRRRRSAVSPEPAGGPEAGASGAVGAQ